MIQKLVFAPMGGFRAVTDAFVELAKDHGVTIHCNTTVTSVQSNGVYVCDSSNNDESKQNTFLPADFVIINADLPYAAKTLVASNEAEKPENKTPKYDWDDKFDYSSGVIAFHWAIDIQLKDLNTHNVFLAANTRSVSEDSWRVLRTEEKIIKRQKTNNAAGKDDSSIEPMNFYVHRPTETDSSAAPPGCDSILILVPCDSLYRNEEYADLTREESLQKYKEQFNENKITAVRQAVLNRLAAIESLKDLKDHIVNEVVDTPGTYADKYNLAAGTPFALSHGFGQLSLTRPGPQYKLKKEGNNNILYCGASSRPGNGVPLVLIGAKLVAKKALNMIIEKQQKEQEQQLKEQAAAAAAEEE